MKLMLRSQNGLLAAFLAACFLPLTIFGAEIPFQLHEGHLIVVKGSIGELRDLNLVIDTGATSTVISRRMAETLGLSGPYQNAFAFAKRLRVQKVIVPSVTIGLMRFDRVPALVCKLAGLGSLQIDGLVGMNLLKQTGLSIDYESRTISLGPVTHSASSIPIYTDLPFVTVPVRSQGKVMQLLLDTGSGHLIFFERRVRGRLSMTSANVQARLRHEGGSAKASEVTLRNITIGDAHWKELSGFLLPGSSGLGFDGILGVASLGLRRLHLDFERKIMSWERRDSLETASPYSIASMMDGRRTPVRARPPE